MLMITHKLYYLIFNSNRINYFYEPVSCTDPDGKQVFAVFIIDPDGAVYECTFDCLESGLENKIIEFLEEY